MIDLVKTAGDLGIGVDDLKMLLGEYFDPARELLVSLNEAIALSDYKAVMMHAHSLKGVSANMGVESICAFAAQIEDAGRKSDSATCLKLIGEAKVMLETEEKAVMV